MILIRLLRAVLTSIAPKLDLTKLPAPNRASIVRLSLRARSLFPPVTCPAHTEHGLTASAVVHETAEARTSGTRSLHFLATLVTRKTVATGVRTILVTSFVTLISMKPRLGRKLGFRTRPTSWERINFVTVFTKRAGLNAFLILFLVPAKDTEKIPRTSISRKNIGIN